MASGVEIGVDLAGGLGLLDQGGEGLGALFEAPAHERGHLRVAAGSDEGLEEQRLAVVEGIGDEMGADRGEHVGHPSLEAVLGEELLELVVAAGLDGGEQQLGLAPESTVDGAGREAGAPGDLLDAGAVVPLLGEHRGRGLDEAVSGGVPAHGCDFGHHPRIRLVIDTGNDAQRSDAAVSFVATTRRCSVVAAAPSSMAIRASSSPEARDSTRPPT